MSKDPNTLTRVTLTRQREQIDKLEESVLSLAGKHGYSTAETFAIRLALEEAVSNAFRHGNKGLPEDAPIEVEYSVTGSTVRIEVSDQGPGFDPASIPDPTLQPNLESPSGRGIMLIRAYMTKVTYNESGNRLSMVFERPE